MIINNKYLNSKPVYELPEGVQIGMYKKECNAHGVILPTFIPDVCINSYGTVGVRGYKDTAIQWCIKTSDDRLLKYLRGYDWGGIYNKCNSIVGSFTLNKWHIEKIISEYYKGIEDDNK